MRTLLTRGWIVTTFVAVLLAVTPVVGAPSAARTTIGGVVAIPYNLSDPNSAPLNIVATYSTDGGSSWRPATMGPGGDGTTNLSTKCCTAYVSHTYVWDTLTDIGTASVKGAIIRLTPSGQGPIDLVFDVDNTGPRPNAQIKTGPYVQGTTTSMTRICWTTLSTTDSVVEYGLSPSFGSTASAGSGTIHVVEIDGLQANTTYYYKLVVSGTEDAPTYTFKTAPQPGTTFTALVFGDCGSGTQPQFDVAGLMTKQTFDLMLQTGDIVYPSGELRDYPSRFFTAYQRMVSTHPIFPCIGDHDQYDGLDGDGFQQTFYMTPNNPQGSKHYYSYVWGDMKVVTVDTGDLFENDGPWWTWFEQELANNSSRWLVVNMYEGAWSAGQHPDDGTYLRTKMVPLLEKYKVDLVLQGHDHIYERTGPIKQYSTDPTYAGWRYIETGCAGAEPYRVLKPLSWDLHDEEGTHFVMLTVSPTSISGKMITIAGATDDTFTITKGAAPPTGTLTTIQVSPNPASVGTGGTQTFTAQGFDENGQPMNVAVSWSATGGTIDASGKFTAGSTTGTFDVAASSGSVTGHASVTVSAAPPPGAETIVDNDASGFSVLSGSWGVHFTPTHYGANNRTLDSGAGSCRWTAALPAGTYDVYAWWPSRASSTGAKPTFTVHSTQGDVSVVVDETVSTSWGVWNKLGTFSLDATASVTITGASGTNPAADAVRFVQTSGGGTPSPVLTSISVTPNPASVATGGTKAFTAQGRDQNGQPMDVSVAWSATGGTIDATGLYTAGSSAGTFSVTATSGSVSGSATVNVTAPPPPPPQQVLTTIVVTPNPASTTPNGVVAFTAQAKDQDGQPMDATFTWTTSAGTIDTTGRYTAPNGTGSFDVSASSQGIVGHATVNVASAPAEVIIDDATPGWSVVSGTWAKHFNPYRYGPADQLPSSATAECQWKPTLASGSYDVYVWVPSRTAPALATYTIATTSGVQSVNLDQSQSTVWGVWTKLGTFALDGSTASVHLVAASGQNVAADAVRFVQVGP